MNSGEVLTDDSGHQPPVVGDAVNVAARLQQVADAGEIIIGDSTYRLVRDAVRVEPVPGLELKGKVLPVPAWRLLEVDPEAYRQVRRTDAPMVGREDEIDLLWWAYRRAMRQRRCHLVTVLGDAGVGKTRLVDEFERAVAEQATVLRGRCRAYGEGITYRPIAQIVRQLAQIDPDDTPQTGYRKLAVLLGEDGPITHQVAQVLGLRRGALEPRDTYWALQRMLEALAGRRPLILVIDDLHWAQPALLEFGQHVEEWSRDAPLLLICLARPELFDQSREWSGSKLNAVSMLLSPLTGDQTRQMVRHVLRQGAVAADLEVRLAEAAAGYPLFVEELLGMLIDDQRLHLSDGEWAITGEVAEVGSPPTIHALLSARLDELAEIERRVLGRAAVVGTRFATNAIAALSPEFDEPELRAALMALARKELLRLEPTAGDLRSASHDRFRFRHSLIREAAYATTPKETRAALHERYASWLERDTGQTGEGPPEVDEVVGYHLAEAYRLRAQLGRLDTTARALRGRAGERLAAAGHRAALRGDIPATAVKLLDRAVELLPEGHQRRLPALVDLADALREAESLERAQTIYREAIELAAARGDERYGAHATLGLLDTLWFTDPGALGDGGRQEAERIIGVLERFGDDLGIAKALRMLAHAHFSMGRSVNAQQAVEQAIGAAKRAGDERWEARIVRLYCLILFWGPTPLDQVVDYTNQALEWARGWACARWRRRR